MNWNDDPSSAPFPTACQILDVRSRPLTSGNTYQCPSSRSVTPGTTSQPQEFDYRTRSQAAVFVRRVEQVTGLGHRGRILTWQPDSD